MGLDLYHLRATLTPDRPEDAHQFYEEDFDEYALDVLGFRRFLQTIPDVDYPSRILVVRDAEALRFLKAHRPGALEDDVELWVGVPADLGRRVEQFERDQGLVGVPRLIWYETSWIDQRGVLTGFSRFSYGDFDRPPDLRHWESTEAIREEIRRRPPREYPPAQSIRVCYEVPAPYRGLYAEEVGYQRKGMY